MLQIFYLYDIVANRNTRVSMESHNNKIEKKPCLERIGRFFNDMKEKIRKKWTE